MKAGKMRSLLKSLWISRLVEHHCFLRVKDVAGTVDALRLLVLCSGPNCARTMMLSKTDGSDVFGVNYSSMKTAMLPVMIPKLEDAEVGYIMREIVVSRIKFFQLKE